MREDEGLPEGTPRTFRDAVELSRALERRAKGGGELPKKFKNLIREDSTPKKPY